MQAVTTRGTSGRRNLKLQLSGIDSREVLSCVPRGRNVVRRNLKGLVDWRDNTMNVLS